MRLTIKSNINVEIDLISITNSTGIIIKARGVRRISAAENRISNEKHQSIEMFIKDKSYDGILGGN